MSTDVTVGLAILTWLIRDTVHQAGRLHVNDDVVRKGIAIGTERSVPEAVGVSINGIGWWISRLVAVRSRCPAGGSHGFSICWECCLGLGVSSGRDLIHGNTIVASNTVTLDVLVVLSMLNELLLALASRNDASKS